MFQLIAGLVMAGILAATLYAGWASFTNGYRTEGAVAQKAADQQVVDLAEARATRAEASAAAAAAASKQQSEALQREAVQSEAARAEAKAVGEAYSRVVKSSEARIAALKAAASGPVLGGVACEDVLARTDKILRESARAINSK